MKAIKAHFDGQKVIFPEEAHDVPPGEVIVIFQSDSSSESETAHWMKAQEAAFEKAWDNDEDAVYDSL